MGRKKSSPPPSAEAHHRATVAAGFVTGLLSGARGRGLETQGFLQAAGIAPERMRDRDARVPIAAYVDLYNIVARELGEVFAGVGLDAASAAAGITRETAEVVARAARRQAGTTHALAVLIDLDEGPDRIEFGGSICLAIAADGDEASRRSRIVGGREWVRLGAVEMGLDCLRRHLQGLPVVERIDFEKV